jgi:hypothetical protein
VHRPSLVRENGLVIEIKVYLHEKSEHSTPPRRTHAVLGRKKFGVWRSAFRLRPLCPFATPPSSQFGCHPFTSMTSKPKVGLMTIKSG